MTNIRTKRRSEGSTELYRPLLVRLTPDIDRALAERSRRSGKPDNQAVAGIARQALREHLGLEHRPETTTTRSAKTAAEASPEANAAAASQPNGEAGPPRNYRQTFIRLTPDIEHPLREAAAMSDRPLAGIVRQALREHLGLEPRAWINKAS